MKHLKIAVLALSILVVSVTLFASFAWTGQAGKGQAKNMKAELPSAVLEAFKAAYPQAVIKGTSKETEKGVTYYEVESIDGMMNRDLLYTADGKTVEVEESVASGALPAAVRQVLAKAYPGNKLLKAEELTKDGQVFYELQIRFKGKASEVTIDPSGKIIENVPEPPAPMAAGYHLIKKHVLGGEGGWDYMALDGRTRLLYVTHGNAVEILNIDSGVKAATISDLKGVHGVAFDPARNRGYISNGRGNSVSVFDLESRKILIEIPTSGQNPDSIMYDAFSDRVFTFNGRTANATAIDAATDKVVGTVDIGGKPEFAVTDGKGTIFVNNEDTSEIVAFDALAGAGALRSTANDMLKFLAAAMGLRETPLRKAVDLMLQTRRPTGTPDLDIAMGWHVWKKYGTEIVWHNGGTGGFRSFAGFDPAKKTGVVVLCNTSFGVDDLGLHALEPQWPAARLKPPVERKDHQGGVDLEAKKLK